MIPADLQIVGPMGGAGRYFAKVVVDASITATDATQTKWTYSSRVVVFHRTYGIKRRRDGQMHRQRCRWRAVSFRSFGPITMTWDCG